MNINDENGMFMYICILYVQLKCKMIENQYWKRGGYKMVKEKNIV